VKLRWLALAPLAGLAMPVVAPAVAADHTVHATVFSNFSPATVNIAVGDSVTWVNDGGTHNVRFADGSFEDPPDPASPGSSGWTDGVSRRFDTDATLVYYCELHGSPTFGMRGTVAVSSGAAAPPPGDADPPEITDLRATPSRLCNVRGCRKRGTRFRFDLSEAADVEGTVTRRGVRREIEASGEQGANSIRFAGRGLKPGRYRLTLRATDSAGNESEPARLRFRVVRP
jgi:plastocyanin